MYCTDAQYFGRSGWGWCPRARGGSRTCACLCARLVGMSALVGFGNEATGVAGQRPRAGALEGCHPILSDHHTPFLTSSGGFGSSLHQHAPSADGRRRPGRRRADSERACPDVPPRAPVVHLVSTKRTRLPSAPSSTELTTSPQDKTTVFGTVRVGTTVVGIVIRAWQARERRAGRPHGRVPERRADGRVRIPRFDAPAAARRRRGGL